MTTICRCGKRGYGSATAAKEAHRTAPFRIRPYLCDEKDLWHVANQDKDRLEFKPAYGGRKNRGHRKPRELAPERSLEEIEAIAARMRARQNGGTP